MNDRDFLFPVIGALLCIGAVIILVRGLLKGSAVDFKKTIISILIGLVMIVAGIVFLKG